MRGGGWRRIGFIAVAALAMAACASSGHGADSSTSAPGPAHVTWVDQQVTFQSQGLTIYASYRHPEGDAARVPAVLLIAGSGPTDRNGNSALEPGPVNTLHQLAIWLSEDGVASLRYDKLGSGKTGVGPYASKPADIGIGVFEAEAIDALRFLASQPGVDTSRLGVFGHSEGGLFALLWRRALPVRPRRSMLSASSSRSVSAI